MKCHLHKHIDHSGKRDVYTSSFFHCPLLSKESDRMREPAIVCAWCCLKLVDLLQVWRTLPLKSGLSSEEIKRNPKVIMNFLPTDLKQYYLALQNFGITFKDMELECSHCKGKSLNPPPPIPEPTEMSFVHRNW